MICREATLREPEGGGDARGAVCGVGGALGGMGAQVDGARKALASVELGHDELMGALAWEFLQRRPAGTRISRPQGLKKDCLALNQRVSNYRNTQP